MKLKRLYQFISIILALTLFMQAAAPTLFSAQVMASSQSMAGTTAVSPPGDELFQMGPDLLSRELADQLLGTDADGLPEGMLMDAGATRTAVNQIATEPAALADPLSVARVQSAYVPGSAISNTLAITFTLTNNRPPTLFPSLPVSATITDTVSIFGSFDFTADPNTIRNVILVDTLTSNAAFLDASPRPDQQAADVVFNLGDIPPMGSVTATLRVAVPASVTDFTNLDVGATAYGTLQGRLVSAAAAPATLAPDSFANTLRWTPDADIYDQEMLQKAAELGSDPGQLFAFVRSLGYESYQGSLRGTRGTLWSAAGNSLDQASLLIALLRASGVPARYARGTLSMPLAQELILSMFPAPVEVIGHIPPGTEVSDPTNDPELLAETQDHWWVEAYVGGQWLSLDPTFARAQPGDLFATATSTLAEAPDSQRHKVMLQLKVERYTLLSAVTGDVDVTYPLTATFNTVELVGRPVTLNHLVSSSGGGGVFTLIEHTYIPYFIVGDYEQAVEGAPYQDIFSNFVGGLGNIFTTGAWLYVSSTDPSGNTESFEREIKDLIGPEARQAGGIFDLSQTRQDTSAPLYKLIDMAQVHVLPHNQATGRPLQQQWAYFAKSMPGILEIYKELPLLDPDDPVASAGFVGKSAVSLQLSQIAMLDSLQEIYSLSAESVNAFYSDSLLTQSYPASPKLLLLSQSVVSRSLETSFELLNVRQRVIPSPGQNKQAAWATQFLQSIGNKAVEANLLQQSALDHAESAFLVMQAAQETGIQTVLVTPETLGLLNSLNISEEAKARITKALLADDTLAIQVPREMVLLDGREQIGWAEIDMETGYVEYVYENGRRALVEYAVINALTHVAVYGIATLEAYVLGFFTAVMVFLAFFMIVLIPLLSLLCPCVSDDLTKDILRTAAGMAASLLLVFVGSACLLLFGILPNLGHAWCLGLHVGAGAVFGATVSYLVLTSDPPLTDILIRSPRPDNAENFASVRGVFSRTQPAGTLSGLLATSLTQISQQTDLAWTLSPAAHSFTFSDLSMASATLYENGVMLAQGAVQIEPASGPENAVLHGANVTTAATGNGRHAFYATALPGLGAGTGWLNHTAVLTAGQPYTLTLENADITVNGTNSYSGSFTLVASGPTGISGSGQTTAPSFAPALSGQMQNGRLLTGPAQGTFLVGGQPLDVSNGVAIAGYTGPITLTESSAATDQLALAGSAQFFTLRLPPTSTTDPYTPVILTPAIEANFTDAYTLTAEAPAGWDVAVAATGVITATPPPGATPADYAILVTAQSGTYPDLFVSAVHTVTTTPTSGMALAVIDDPLLTVPMGPLLDPAAFLSGHNGHVDNGRAEVPGAAYTINLTNTSTVSHTFDVTVSGLPAGWLVLSGAAGQSSTSLTLPAGSVGQLGLYISPTVSTILPPGTSHTIDITARATNGSGLSDSQTIVWAMPAVPFPYLQLEPTIIYAVPDSTTTVDLDLINVGNSGGSFPVTSTARANIYGSQPYVPSHTLIITPATFTSSVLGSGQASVQPLTLDTTGALVGEQYLLASQSTAGAYRPATYALVQIVSLTTWPIFQAADDMSTSCTPGEPGLSAALENLALSVSELEATCAAGSCSLAARDKVVTTLDGVASYATPISPQVTAGPTLQTIAGAMAAHSSNADLAADMAAISTTVGVLVSEVCELSEHRPDVRFTPYLDAVLLGDTAVFSLTVSNAGTLTTTYVVTVTTPSSVQSYNPTLVPGETAVLPISTTPTTLGSYDLAADVVPTGPDVNMAIVETTEARLNVVDKFVQVTAVTADPPFVESGSSATTLSVDVTNVANVARLATARATILAPNGSVSYTADIPMTLLVGPLRVYQLTTVNTSGWAEGVYTATVELLDATMTLIANGSGVGYLGVGQALGASHAIYPAVVAPGTVTVTTILTTELLAQTILAPISTTTRHSWPNRPLLTNELAANGNPITATAAPVAAEDVGGAQPVTDNPLPLTRSTNALSTTWSITRTEDSRPAVVMSGSWTSVSNAAAVHASNSDYHYSQTIGDSVTFTFTGTWAAIGLATSSLGGYTEIFVDGASRGLVDLYSQSNDVKRVTIAGLTDTAHVITATVTGNQNPFSSNIRVGVDYFDTWDGTSMPDGMVEQDNGRVWLSGGWVNRTSGTASGGSYYRSGWTAWYPFTGDSITFQALTDANAEQIAIYLDDNLQGYYDLADFSVQTRTFTFDGLGGGPHVLTVRAFRGAATIDAFTTPATEPATPPPAIGSFHRFEENDLSILYNGTPFPQTATSWVSAFNDTVSDHYTHYSASPGDGVQFTFTGTAVIAGFYGETRGGYAEVFIDGVSQGVVDTYRRSPAAVPVFYRNLANATHTLTITVLGQANPFATANRVYLDYIDVWDGTPLPDGVFEELDGRLYRSFRWTLANSTQASGGQYLQDDITGQAHLWFPFTGDSITLRAIANSQGSQWNKVYIDGQPLAEINLYNNTPVSRTYSFNNLGPGLHVLHLEKYRGELMVDAFTTPGSTPFYQTPVYTGVVRYEEDHPALRYDGVAYAQRPRGWSESFQGPASGGYASLSTTANDTVSLTFDGRWVSAGFFTNQQSGQAEIFVDGLSRGTIGLYSASGDVTNFSVGNLVTGTHTVSITVLGISDPPGAQARVHLDYIDVWDGAAMPDEIANASQVSRNGRVHTSYYHSTVSNSNAIDGDYVTNVAGNPEANVWYAFTGDSFTFYGFSANAGASLMDVFVDGQFVATVDAVYPFTNQPLAYHYSGFGSGPHVVRINNNAGSRVDAFASNQPSIGYRPLAEWWESSRTAGGSVFGGLHVPPAVGDVTGDGRIEIAVPSSNWDHQGELFLLNGNGGDAGGGTPIIWTVPFDIFNGFEDVGAPAIADLDGQPGAEIVMATSDGMYAFHNDGSTYWFTDTVRPNIFFGTPAIGNLDLDAEPEVVINLDQTLVVFEQNGAIAWTFTDVDGFTMPLLADLTGDGLLDILLHDWNDTLYLFDYNLGNPQLVWTAVFANPLHGYGSAAVADLNGDGTPEVAIATETELFALNAADGSVQWSAPLDPGRTGGVTIADIDGDGAVELVTGVLFNGGTLYAFEADGTLKWAVPALDTSPLNTSAADLDGDGAYELLWNGKDQGFTIYDGRTGNTLFNDPLIVSATGSDVPVVADVDQDGYAEVVVPAQDGIRVMGFDGVWGPARPLWNQLSYHITNIEDNLHVPYSEANSWTVHNSYRAQTDLTRPLPGYQVVLSHTVGLTGVTVLTNTFNVPPETMSGPQYGWKYVQSGANIVVTRTFASVLTGLKPGDIHLVAQGTAVSYTLPSGSNRLQLPPLYASAPHIVALSPATKTVGVGGTAVFDIVLSNPSAAASTYTLSVSGLPAPWLTFPFTLPLASGSVITVPLAVAVPATASAGAYPFILNVANRRGDTDQAGASLQVIDGLDLAIDPPELTAVAGTAVTYTMTLTNQENVARVYNLANSGLAIVTLPATVTVAAKSSVTLPLQVTAIANGPHPFTVGASTNAASDSATALFNSVGNRGVEATLSPGTAVGGPGTPAVFTATITNRGSLFDTYNLSANLPAGWSYRFIDNNSEIGSIGLTPHVFNQADLRLLITPALTATAGFYDFTVTAASQGEPAAPGVVTGTVEVLARGVQVGISPAALTLTPTDTGVWQVTITNTGSVADSYWLTPTGIIAPSGQFSTNPVSLAPGHSTGVTLSAGTFEPALATTYPFAVVASSQNDGRIQNQATGAVTFTGYEDVRMSWVPVSQTLTNTLTATFMMVVTNTGNISTLYDLSAQANGLDVTLETYQVYIPPHITVGVLVRAQAAGGGTYMLNGRANSPTSTAAAADTAILILAVGTMNDPVATADTVITAEDTAATVNALANDYDLDGDMLTVASITQPANGVATINLDQTLIYTPALNFNGGDAFTYTISDGNGGTGTATVTVTVTGVNDNPVAVPDMAVTDEVTAVTIDVLLNDTDVDGDLLSVTGVTTPTHGTAVINGDSGVTYTPDPDFQGSDGFVYTVSDGAGGSDTATVTVEVLPTAGACSLYPIALHADLLVDAEVGEILPDILNGTQPGNFGWLTWSGNNSVSALVASLTPPGNSHTYVNPYDPADHAVSIGDWVDGKPGVSNAKAVRNALEVLTTMDIVVPVWNTTQGNGANVVYEVSGFARIRLMAFNLSGQDQITAQFLGYVSCGNYRNLRTFG